MRKAIIALVIVFGLIIGGIFLFGNKAHAPVVIKDFDECAAQGYPIIETYPRQCRTPDKQVFIEIITQAKSDSIEVTSPQAGAIVSSPLAISGKARGAWFFEASFPVKLIDADGAILASAPAEAQGGWMTTDFVPFSLSLVFKNPSTKTGTLIFSKDNPSGLPQNDDSIRVPVVFKNVMFGTTTASTSIPN